MHLNKNQCGTLIKNIFTYNLVVPSTMVPKVTNANDEDLDEFVTTLRTQLEIYITDVIMRIMILSYFLDTHNQT